MQLPRMLSSRRAAAVVAAVVVIGFLAAFQPITRNVVFRDAICLGCHQGAEYVPNATPLGDTDRAVTVPHPATPDGGQAWCIECHLPPGLLESTYAYTHVLSRTDLFGHWHDWEKERQGAWLALTARRAYRVRDRMLESDSSSCRTCHIEAEIKPKRKRGQKEHANALKDKETCIVCHNNVVHRPVPERVEAD